MNQDTMGYSVRRINGEEEHLDAAMKLLFILDGSVKVRYQDEDYTLRKEDIMHINPGIEWIIDASDGALLGEASYDVSFLSSILKSDTTMFFCNSSVDDSHSYQDLRDIFYRLTSEYIERTRKSDLLMDQLLIGLLDIMVEHYQIDPDNLQKTEAESDYRMRKIMQYIVANIDRDINLSELADEMYISTSTLSRIFKKHTGVYFADYVMNLRVKIAQTQLAYSDQKLTQIALSCGFSNSATFSRAFRKYLGVTPTEYREQHKKDLEKIKDTQKSEKTEVIEELKDLGYEEIKQESSDSLELNLAEIEGTPLNKNWNRIINIGALFDLTRANIQFHVLFLQEQLHFEYIRVWNVFAKRLMFNDGISENYNFNLIDQTLDFLVQHRLKPFLDFGRRPDMALRTNGDDVFYNDDYIQFQDKERWQAAVTAFLNHILVRYGLDEVSEWCFEFSMNSLTRGEEYAAAYEGSFDYMEAYQYMYGEMRRLIPGAKFGGTGSVISLEWKNQLEFVRECIRREIVPDFLSYIIFPYDDIRLSDGKYGRVLSQKETVEEDQISMMHQLMRETGLDKRGTRLWIVEWNNSISNRNYLNDSCFRAAYIVHKISHMCSQVDSIALMGGSDWISSYMDTAGILNGGIGLISKDTIRKPAFYAMEFLNQLGNQLLVNDDHYIVTRKDNGDLYILCYYYSWFHRSYFLQDEDVNLEHLSTIRFEDEKPLKLTIDITGMQKKGNFIIKKRTLNSKHGSALDIWGDFGYESDLSRNDVKYLDALSTPTLSQKKVTIEKLSDSIHLEVTMEPQELSLLHIYSKN